MIDWSREIEIVSDSGRVCSAVLKPGSTEGLREVYWHTPSSAYCHRFFDNGMPYPGLSCWEVRNALIGGYTYTVRPEDEAALLASDPLSRPTPDERAVALAKRFAQDDVPVDEYLALKAEARAILAALEPDIELEEARKIAKDWLIYDDANTLQANEPSMKAILKAIRRGRQLEKEGK